jgi:asparagine synthase (glutamine-hydrolysing)
MCGITLAFGLDQTDSIEQTISRMTNQLYHRGPNDYGYYIDKERRLAMGHRRLSILDLSPRGHQPMFYDEENLVIVHNGEIYNFREIRDDLARKNYRFNSETDTEVILAAYREWGQECVHRFNGMWAFAILDKRNNTVFCSRDRVGVKPLYYAKKNNCLFIASEIKAILAAGVSAEINPVGLNEYFSFQNIISPNTLFNGIVMLPAGHNLSLDLVSGASKISEYWDMRYAPDSCGVDEKYYIEELRDVFYRAMQRHMISDAEVGATISGGMDSSAIASIASKHFGRIHTFTGGFNTDGIDADDRCYNELDDARIIAKQFGTMHHERLIVPQDIVDTMPFIVWHLEDPKVGMCYTFYTISQLVSRKVTVNLSGTGGDELFAGYPWRYNLILDKTASVDFDAVYYDWWCRIKKDHEKNTFFHRDILKNIDPQGARNAYKAVIERAKDYAPINKALYFDMKTFLHGFLMVEDKMGMAYSIETRFPFIDKEMLDFMAKLPDHLKFRNGTGKYLLKKAFESLLPEDIIYKRKQGFTPPDKTWYRRELRDYIESMLLSKKTLIYEYINRNAVEGIVSAHNNGVDKRLEIWSLLFFEGWCRVFLRGDIVAPVLF